MTRVVPSILGLSILIIAWFGPLGPSSSVAFSAHMTVHMSVVAIAAPILAIAMAGTRLDPVRRVPGLFSPLLASLLELFVVWAWHTPALHGAARHNTAVLFAEQGTFLITGIALWISVFGGDSQTRAARSAHGIVALLLTAMHMTLLGALIALSPRPLYSHSELDDQHLGGAIMLLVGGISYLAGGLWLSLGLLTRPSKESLQRL